MAAKAGRIDGVALGVKVGTYWPGNAAEGLPAHASTVLLLDGATGIPIAIVGASHLTALRTAAADAVAVDALARPDATALALVGAGHQAFHDAVAIARVRTPTSVAVWGRRPDQVVAMVVRLLDAGLPARPADLEEAVSGADIVCTVTSSHEPLIRVEWVQPGTHISAMGADAAGKQELEVGLIRAARCVVDVAAQAVTIGELQHAAAAGVLDVASLVSLGDVLAGREQGRRSADEITVFDSSGTAVQDLAVCELARRALERR